MLNLVSVVIGLVGLAFAAVAFLPLLGWANWLVIPLAMIGAAIGIMGLLAAGFGVFLLETQASSRAIRIRNAILEHQAEEQS